MVKRKMSMRVKMLSVLAISAGMAYGATAADQLDQVNARIDSLGDYATSTVMGKDDKPVSASGDLAIRIKNFNYAKTGKLQLGDRERMFGDGLLDVNFSAIPSSFANAWATFSLPFDFSGYFTNRLATTQNGAGYNNPEYVQYLHNTDYVSTTAFENSTAGIDLRGFGMGAMLKAGGVIWTNFSPLTVFERETNPHFPAQYELFQEEQTVSTYYKEKTFKPVKEGGRAFWTNRSFGGLALDAYALPYDFMGQLLFSQPKTIDLGSRDGLRMLGGQPGVLEMKGTLDYRGDVFGARIAKQKIFNDLMLGANYVGVMYDRDIVYEAEFSNDFTKTNPYLINTHIASLDLRGNVNPNVFVMMDLAMSIDDSTKFYKKDSTQTSWEQDTYHRKMSSSNVGFYAKIQDKHWQPITAELVYLPKDFYSPYSISNPSRFESWRKDEFHLGEGTFRYDPNVMGVNLKFEPEFNRGRFDVQYGIHKQIEKGTDVVLFQYRLNGRSMWETTNSWTKFAPLFNMDSGNTDLDSRYVSRVGVLTPQAKLYRQKGGLYGGTWESWESFVPYENVQEIQDSVVPEHVKWSSVVSCDAAYDISNWFNSDRNIMLQVYGTLSGVSTSFSPLAYSSAQKDMLLWSAYVESQPAISITPTFHALGILGFETWRGSQAYTASSLTDRINANFGTSTVLGTTATVYQLTPINYLQTAFGFGFDWDFAPRAGLHFRYKYATHRDETVSANDWNAHIVQAETKVWF